jgi:hypothetical protein
VHRLLYGHKNGDAADDELLLKEISANQDKMDADRKKDKEDFMAKLDADKRTDKEESKVDREEMEAKRKTDKEDLMAKLDAYQAKTDAVLLAMQVMENIHREMVTEATPERDMETIACRETTEARIEEKEPTSVDRKPEAAQQREVPVEDAVVKPVNGRKRRHRGKKQAAERCEEPEDLTRGLCGSRMKLAAACRKASRRATVARRRRDAFKNERTQDGCQRRLAAARRGTSHRAEVDKMPRRATVARRM